MDEDEEDQKCIFLKQPTQYSLLPTIEPAKTTANVNHQIPSLIRELYIFRLLIEVTSKLSFWIEVDKIELKKVQKPKTLTF